MKKQLNKAEIVTFKNCTLHTMDMESPVNIASRIAMASARRESDGQKKVLTFAAMKGIVVDGWEELPGSDGSDERQLQSSGLGFCREKREDYGGDGHKRLESMDSANQQTETPPLGLTLRLTHHPSFLDLLELKLSKAMEDSPSDSTLGKSLKSEKLKVRNDDFGTQSTSEKLKALNFSVLFIKIGSWERTRRFQGDLVAKCYYAKRKFVWEVSDSGLKSKIEIQWSHISAFRATFRENGPGILEIELSHPPLIFHETNPQPRKHSLWKTKSDFTGGQASKYRRHLLRFPEGTLEKLYEKLLQCDKLLYLLSLKPFPTLSSPYFHSSPRGFLDYCHNLNMKIPTSAAGFNSTFKDSSMSQFPCTATRRSLLVPNQKIPNFELLRPTISVNSPCSGVQGQVRDQRNLFWNENGSRGIGNRRRLQIQESTPITSASQITSLFPRHLTSNSLSPNLPMLPSASDITCFLPQHLMSNSPSPNSNWSRQISSNNWSLNAIAEELLDESSTGTYADEQKILEKVNSMHSLLSPAQMNLIPECVGVKHGESGPGKNTEDLMISNSSGLTYEDDGYPSPIPICEVIPLNSLPQIPSYPHLFLDQEAQISVNEPNMAWSQWRN